MNISELYVIFSATIFALSVGVLFWKIYQAVKQG